MKSASYNRKNILFVATLFIIIGCDQKDVKVINQSGYTGIALFVYDDVLKMQNMMTGDGHYEINIQQRGWTRVNPKIFEVYRNYSYSEKSGQAANNGFYLLGTAVIGDVRVGYAYVGPVGTLDKAKSFFNDLEYYPFNVLEDATVSSYVDNVNIAFRNYLEKDVSE